MTIQTCISLAHAESYAIDLMWDMVCRFVPHTYPVHSTTTGFVSQVRKQITSIVGHVYLTQLGSLYGDLTGHEGLWDAAYETRKNILARLAVRFEKANDKASLEIIVKNYREETTHVEAGARWFRFVCKLDGADPIARFHEIIPHYYKGRLKPPVNKEARAKAGMLEEWYLPLSVEAGDSEKQTRRQSKEG
ncbi:unnamed protein product [Peronospora belbahrii]|uniref:Ferritin-like domain-containing protein n=1 Tax=Peronospora belbahrii TaxID=622444 RepID=A0ABN8D348_9STRA|nr:unnamed protein product [Peronospora belbahrii]